MKCQSFPWFTISSTPSLCVVLLFCSSSIGIAAESGLDIAKIESITGLKGVSNEKENTFKVSKPRNDVAITVEQVRLAPFMGFTSWAAFTPGMKDGVMVMGDMVLFEDEVNPVMSVALDAGLEVTALHNHFFFDEPKVYFMHIGGEGSVEKLASAVKLALAKQKEIRAANPTPGRNFGGGLPATSSINAAPLEAIFGGKAQTKDGMAKFVFGREATMACGCKVGKEMGVNTWAAFAGTDENAVADGDFAVLADELQPALRSMRKSGVNIVAIHHHLTQENPRIFFLHYWARGRAADLARSLKAAL